MTEVMAQAKYLRVSPSKLREAAAMIKNLNFKAALDQLKFSPKKAAGPLLRVIESAVANGNNNLKLNSANWRIKIMEIGEGPKFKRSRAVSRGVAHPYLRRTSNIKVILEAEN